MKVVSIVQARLNSSRFPEKVFADLAGKPLIWHVFNRIKCSKRINEFVLATTENSMDDKLVIWAKNNDIKVFRGSENNVLERYYFAAKKYNADIIVRITADDPFKDADVIDAVIDMLISEKLDFSYNNNPPSFPEGMDVEVFTFESLEQSYFSSEDDFEKEHVTQFMYRNRQLFKQKNYKNNIDLSNFRWTIDTKQDYIMAKTIYEILYDENNLFGMKDILKVIKDKPEISLINNNVKRSDMYIRK